ncbi:General transcription factor 3C polypeptide 2 [Stylophora pistillata]|uniref:General transcription factor 3C polypeptide 2 n=1 Tax=Stylophora pistillata TaxID=50429 RepID=A0A2B4RH75_STYPI|nr:General transcription factor 3C polypeptide 2 [Stylophora pistillata]
MSLFKDSDDLPIKLNLDELKEELSKNGVVLCPVEGCDHDFKSLWGLKYHIRQANHEEVASERKFKCEQCNQIFQSRVTLREHRALDHHSGNQGGSLQTSPKTFKEMKGNATSSEGTVKKKRGRPRKNTDTSAKSNNSATSDLTERKRVAGEISSPSVEIPKKTENSDGTERRTSTRVRTPRKDIFVYEEEDTTESKRGNKQLKRKENSETGVSDHKPKKRGRKPKSLVVENVTEGCNILVVSGKKRGRKRKGDTASCEFDDGDGDIKVESGAGSVSGGEDSVHKSDVASEVEIVVENGDNINDDDDVDDSVDHNNDDDGDGDNVDDDFENGEKSRKKKPTRVKTAVNRKAVAKPGKRGRSSKITQLKRLMKSGQSLICTNQGCRAKFTTALGYQCHMKICGIKEEEREKFPCEICGKQYMSYPGLTYHLKSKHSQSEPINCDHSEVKDEVQQITTDQELEEIKLAKNTEKGALSQLISKIKGRVVSKEQENQWTEMLKTESDIVCPGVPKGMEKSDSSDVDFKVVSSGESEDDSDDVEIEEIEESGSDLNDDAEDAEEIFVWDDKRTKFTKPRKKRKQPARASGENVGFGPIGAKDSESYITTDSWRKQEYTDRDLFPNLRPSTSYWRKVEISEVDQYLPEATTSPPFQIRRKGDSQCLEESIELPLFGSTSKDHSPIHGDVTFNVGGPVWAMDWCPVPDSTKNSEQFLAISTHRSLDEVHKVHKCFSSKGLIQLWNAGQLKVNSASSGSKPTLSLGIAHDFGAIWDISWCPSGTWEPSSSYTNQKECLSRLGVIAVACSDGLVRILSIPWPSELKSVEEVKDSESNFKTGIASDEFCAVIFRLIPHALLIPCSLGVAYNGESGQAWCAKWFPCAMHEKIAAGFSDGSVAIWNLLTESPLLKETDNDGKAFRLAPFLHIPANSSVIKDLAWCHECPDYLVTGGYDRMYKVWNLRSPLIPVAVIKRGIPHEIHWPYGFANVISCEDDAFQTLTHPCVARYFTFQTNKDERLTSLVSTHNCTIWSISMSEWSNILACGDAAGEVVAVHVLPKKKKTFTRFAVYRAFLEQIAGNTSSSEQNKEDVYQGEQTNADSFRKTQTDGCSTRNNGSSIDRTMKEISASADESSTNASTSKSGSDEMMKTTNKSEKTDSDAAGKKGIPTPPKTLGEVFEKHRLVFYDVNALEFKDRVNKSDPDFKRLLSPSTMQTIPYDQFANPQAIQKVRFNPSKQSYMWLASGSASGLARLHLVKQVTT